MVDTIIVGRYVGADALAAVGSTGTIMFLLTGFSQGITAGFAILISQRYGAHDADGVKQAVANEKSPHSRVSSRYESRSFGLPCSSRSCFPVNASCW